MNPITVSVIKHGGGKDTVTVSYTDNGAVIKTGDFEFTITNNVVTPVVTAKKTVAEISWDDERQIAYRKDAVLKVAFLGGTSDYIEVVNTNGVDPVHWDRMPVIECFYVIDLSNLSVDTLVTRESTLYSILTQEESFAKVQQVGNTLRIPTYWWNSGLGYKTCLINPETNKQLEIFRTGIVQAFRIVTKRAQESLDRLISPRSTSTPLTRG